MFVVYQPRWDKVCNKVEDSIICLGKESQVSFCLFELSLYPDVLQAELYKQIDLASLPETEDAIFDLVANFVLTDSVCAHYVLAMWHADERGREQLQLCLVGWMLAALWA